LDLAVVSLPDWHPEAPSRLTAPVYGYVIVHPEGAIVFDTGVGFGNAFIDEVYAPERIRLDDALGAVEVDASSIVAVVNSHLHFDHCGQNPLLYGTSVPFFVQQPELDELERDRFYTDTEWALPPVAQRRLIDGDLEIAEGVTILSTPGHTPGHQSVVIESADGCVVLAGQAVWELREFVEERATKSNVFSDEYCEAAIASIRRIKALAPQLVFFAHCAPHATNEGHSTAAQ
jgi:glyoxylase-like metal-dependent hydrolase (beta-lactamase superfamily II)